MYKQYALPVKKIVFGLCHNNDIADEITADTFYKAVCNIDNFKEGNMLAWLCTIAKNTYFDYIGKKDNKNISLSDEVISIIPSDYGLPETDCISRMEQIRLLKQIQKIEGIAKDVIYLRIFANLSFKEIGEIVGKSENWARVTFYRSKNKLKGWIENEK